VQTISNAFCEQGFKGNPAATLILEEWFPASTMQAIAEQNNIPETTFLLHDGMDFRIRWFTPEREVYLAGHATLAAAHCLSRHHRYRVLDGIRFKWERGEFTVIQEGDIFWMEFDAQAFSPSEPHAFQFSTPCAHLRHAFLAQDAVAVLSDAEAVLSFDPHAVDLIALPGRGLAITAPGNGNDCDYVSRFFCPRYGVPEDPVTGSSHAIVARYWSEHLGKKHLVGHQLSSRGGVVHSKIQDEKTWIGGRIKTFGHAFIDPGIF
jgi:predicted PhzF superfamily epimerase YddE/YHI9